MVDTNQTEQSPDIANKSVVKAGRLLRELGSQSRKGATVTELARATGISRPTAFRLLYSLEQAGLVDRIDNNYILGWEMARLGRHADPYSGIAARAQAPIQELADQTNESATLSVPNQHDGLDVIVEATGSHVLGVTASAWMGREFPLHASSGGKILLAEWPAEKVSADLPEHLERLTDLTITDRSALLRELGQVREQGYAIIDNELEDGLLSVSRPIRDSAGTLVATLSVNGPRYRFGRDRIPQVLEQLRATAELLEKTFWRD